MSQQFVRQDKVGFPIIWIPPLNSYIHWLPFTKIQMEYFLSETTDSTFNEDWYNVLLDSNNRVAPGSIRPDNYWQAFLTGITAVEARRVSSWYNGELMTAQEWQTAYRFLRESSPANFPYMRDILNLSLRPRVALMLRNLDSIVGLLPRYGQPTVADQCFMRGGVMEYVYEDDRRNTFAGYGQTNRDFFSTLYTPDGGTPERLAETARLGSARIYYYGFRLKVRG